MFPAPAGLQTRLPGRVLRFTRAVAAASTKWSRAHGGFRAHRERASECRGEQPAKPSMGIISFPAGIPMLLVAWIWQEFSTIRHLWRLQILKHPAFSAG